MILAAAAALAALTFAPAALAGMPVTQKVTCPIGGREFNFTTTASYSTWGARPDGKPFGSWEFPLAIPECPDNGLVVYQQFSREDVARLRPLVASDEYQALRRGRETTYYRASWLMRRMGAPATHSLWALVQASWQAESDPPRRRRYLEELVARAPELGEPGDAENLAVRSRVINALRELGRFEEAAAMIAATPVDRIAPPSEEVRSAADWRSHYRTLARIVARRDSSIEPIDMIPYREARRRCDEGGDSLSDGDRALCREWDEVRAREQTPAPVQPQQ
jgi:hypothetical protein